MEKKEHILNLNFFQGQSDYFFENGINEEEQKNTYIVNAHRSLLDTCYLL